MQLAKHPTAESIPFGPDVNCVLGSCIPVREEVLCTNTTRVRERWVALRKRKAVQFRFRRGLANGQAQDVELSGSKRINCMQTSPKHAR